MHFTAIAQLSTKLGYTLVKTEELLDTALAKQCSNFQPASYAKLKVIITWNLLQTELVKFFPLLRYT